MAQTMTADPASTGSKSLPARIVGVIFSPRAAYADVAARPRWLGAFLTVSILSGAATAAFMASEVGRNAVVDQQIAQAQAFGRQMPQAQIDMMERMSGIYMYIAPAIQLVSFGIGGLIVAGLAFAVFNAMLGGDGTFKQAFSVVVHSGAVLVVQGAFTFPLDYMRETLTSPTNLSVFVPFLEETSFVARTLGSIDLFLIWWMISLSIGLGVLYKKRTGPIATSVLTFYAVIAVIIAAVKSAVSGA